jgi:DNA-binding Xre family transcriptional regulator
VIGLVTSPAQWFTPSCADGMDDARDRGKISLVRRPNFAPPFQRRNSLIAISPRKWYLYRMNGTRAAYSLLPQFLLKRNYTVADLINKLRAKGESFDKKTIYRLVGSEPMRTINSAALGAICEELQVSLGEIITFEPPAPMLKRIDNRSQNTGTGQPRSAACRSNIFSSSTSSPLTLT